MGERRQNQGKIYSFPQDTRIAVEQSCSKADINIVATEKTIFTHWHQECDLLGSDTIARVWPRGYLLRTTTATEKPGSVCFRWVQAEEILSCHVFTNPALRNPLSSLQFLAISDSHEYSENTHVDRGMPL